MRITYLVLRFISSFIGYESSQIYDYGFSGEAK
jgi:hypothetical protein